MEKYYTCKLFHIFLKINSDTLKDAKRIWKRKLFRLSIFKKGTNQLIGYGRVYSPAGLEEPKTRVERKEKPPPKEEELKDY